MNVHRGAYFGVSSKKKNTKPTKQLRAVADSKSGQEGKANSDQCVQETSEAPRSPYCKYGWGGKCVMDQLGIALLKLATEKAGDIWGVF